VLWGELLGNRHELDRLVGVLRAGSLTASDPVFHAGGRLKVQNWQLFIQSPLVASFPPDLFWKIQQSYDVSQRAQEELRESIEGVLGRSPHGWKVLCEKHLPGFEAAVEWVDLAGEQLHAAQQQVEPGNARRD